MQLEDINHRNHTILPPGLAILKVIFILVVDLTMCLFVVVTVQMWNINVLTQKDIMKLLSHWNKSIFLENINSANSLKSIHN